MSRTLEQRLKFDHRLPVGQSLVIFTHEGNQRLALVEITNRGVVRYLLKPEKEEMYSSWVCIKGDITSTKGERVIVWAARDPAFMKIFDGEVIAVVSV